MGKKSALGLIGTIIVAGVGVGLAKYLKDYAGVQFADGEQIDGIKKDSAEVKETAKRTYFAIKEKGDVKEAAAELKKAAEAVISDAAGIAKTAGTETAAAIKDLKARYDEDPEAVKSEVAGNLNEMKQDFTRMAQDKAESIKERFTGAGEDLDIDEAFEDMEEAADGVEDAFKEVTEDAAAGLEAAADAAADAVEEASDSVDSAVDAVADAAGEAAEKAEEAAEEAVEEAKEAVEETVDAAQDAAEAAGEAAAEAAEEVKEVTEDFTATATITDDEN